MIESLEDNLNKFREELDNTSGSAGTLREQIRQKDAEIAEYRRLLSSTQKKLKEKTKECTALENENQTLKEDISASEAARCDLTKICSEHIRNAKAKAYESYNEFTERLLLEREEALSTKVSEQERDVRNVISDEAMAELNELREQYFIMQEKAGRKDKEINFLQEQLIEAADRLSKFEREKKTV